MTPIYPQYYVVFDLKVQWKIVKIMQKRERRSFLQVMSDIFNFRMWIGVDGLKSFFQFILKSFRQMFIPNAHKPSEHEESFSDAQARLALSEEVLLSRQKALYRLSIVLFSLGALLFFYAIFQFMYGTFHGFLLTLSLVGLAWVIGFRYHFWSFQIKERKLGCSLREWYRYGLRGEKR